MEPARPVRMNIYQSNNYRKDLNWLHFDDELWVQERVYNAIFHENEQELVNGFIKNSLLRFSV